MKKVKFSEIKIGGTLFLLDNERNIVQYEKNK